MKKILVSLLVLALCAPAMAATITVLDDGNGTTATIQIATEGAEPNIVGVALDVDLNQGAVDAVSISTANFGVYPDAGFSLGASFDPWGAPAEQGGPVAAQGSAGQVSLPLSSFALSFANLNGETTPGAAGAALIEVVLTLDDPNEITVCENATRGGLVAVDGTALDADCDTVAIAPPVGCKGDINVPGGDGLINALDLSALVGYLNPSAPLYSVSPIPSGDEIYDLNVTPDGVINALDLSAMVGHLNPYAPLYSTTNCMP